jgi:hypothetical protein
MRQNFEGDTGHSRNPANGAPMNLTNLRFVVDGAVVENMSLPQPYHFVGEFSFRIPVNRSRALPLVIHVEGWRRRHQVSLDQCEDEPLTAVQQKLVVSVNLYDALQSTDFFNFTLIALAAEKHARHHLCNVPVATEYEIWLDKAMMPVFFERAYLVENINFVVKSSALPRIHGEGHRFFPIYNNLALLKHWRSGAFLLLCDLDEFVLVPPEKLISFREEVFITSATQLHRIDRSCIDCGNVPEVLVDVQVHDWALLEKSEAPKLIVNPDEAGCHWIHYSDCSAGGGGHATVRNTPPEVAHMAHFPNYFRNRIVNGSGFANPGHVIAGWQKWPTSSC